MSVQSSSVDKVIFQIGTIIILSLLFSEMIANDQMVSAFLVGGAGLLGMFHLITLLFLGERSTKPDTAIVGALYGLTAVCAVGIMGMTIFISNLAQLFNIHTFFGASLIFLGSGRMAWKTYKGI